MTIGNTKAQKIASGSRTHSRSRARVSSTIGDLTPVVFTEVPAGERHEHVFERAVVGDHPRRRQFGDQLVRRAQGDDAAVIHDRDAIAEHLRFVHVMS